MNLIEFHDEARLMWKRHFLITSPTIRMGIMSGLVNILVILGRLSEAAKVIDLYEATSQDETPLGEQLIIYLRSALYAYEGVPFDLDKATEKLSTQFLTSARSSALWYSCAVARTYRISGERDLERAILNRAIDCAMHSKTNYCVGLALADATFSSWFWGEDELFEGYLAKLEDNLTPSSELRFRFFIECVRGRGAAARSWFEKMNVFSLTYLTYASLIAASMSVDSGEARRFSFEALAAADESSQGFVKIITRVALALLDSKRADGLLAEADRLAHKAQSSKLVEAIAALRSGSDDLGMLTHFIARFRNDRNRSKLPTLNVSLVARNVTYGDVEIALSKRGLELVMFLAHQRQSISAYTIAEAMWPGKSGALDTLYVTLGRLRSRLPIEAIDRQGDGYHLTRNVVVDLVIMEERCRAIQGHLPLSESQRSELKVICDRLNASPNNMVPWEWFEGTQARIDRLRNQVVILLAQDAFERKAYNGALSLARTQLIRDECDETACEIAIRAALALDDRLTARNILHAYECSVKREIGTTPPTYLRDIVSGEISYELSATTSGRLTQSA
jgi:DNA-binding winged helix-turn-helix (wHTH) protein